MIKLKRLSGDLSWYVNSISKLMDVLTENAFPELLDCCIDGLFDKSSNDKYKLLFKYAKKRVNTFNENINKCTYKREIAIWAKNYHHEFKHFLSDKRCLSILLLGIEEKLNDRTIYNSDVFIQILMGEESLDLGLKKLEQILGKEFSNILSHILLCLKKSLGESLSQEENTKLYIADCIVGSYFAYDYIMERSSGIKNNSIRKRLFNQFNVRVCPYCNAQIISQIKSKEKKYNRGDIDHWLAKEKYPLFSLSVWNFIPACKVCNETLKNANEKRVLYPWKEGFENDVMLKFRLENPENTFYLFSKENKQLEVLWDCTERDANRADRIMNSIEVFKLDEVYTELSEEIQKFLIIEHDYPEAYNLFLNKFDSEIGVLQRRIGADDYQDTVLGKIMCDISEGKYLF